MASRKLFWGIVHHLDSFLRISGHFDDVEFPGIHAQIARNIDFLQQPFLHLRTEDLLRSFAHVGHFRISSIVLWQHILHAALSSFWFAILFSRCKVGHHRGIWCGKYLDGCFLEVGLCFFSTESLLGSHLLWTQPCILINGKLFSILEILLVSMEGLSFEFVLQFRPLWSLYPLARWVWFQLLRTTFSRHSDRSRLQQTPLWEIEFRLWDVALSRFCALYGRNL